MRAVVVAVLAALLLGGSVAEAKFTISDAWTEVCAKGKAMYGVGCENIAAPWVVISSILEPLRLNGVYVVGEPQIIINPRAPDPIATTIHEMTHYYLENSGVLQARIDNYCEGERVARLFAGQDPDDWRERYGCEK